MSPHRKELRLSLSYTVMSKRILREMVEAGHVAVPAARVPHAVVHLLEKHLRESRRPEQPVNTIYSH